ncbi:MAG: hypothetical protein QOC66_1573 [Pseudonocardiales bacterium]|jgi:pimeloyl-ACP methyl ester carboxylesterase|nr:hypothetical protein [Pseudonocardiales bacterium]
MTTTITTTLAATDLGRGGPALLHLPGWCGGREVFDPLHVRASEHRRAVSVDWPGHGRTPDPGTDFGAAELVSRTVELADELELEAFVPVALSHAGWVGLELRRRLGADRVPAVVLLDWMPLGAPPPFAGALAALQDPDAWTEARTALFAMWAHGVQDPAVHSYIASMGEYGSAMWSRAGREIAQAFEAEPVPLDAFAALAVPCPVLHLYGQPRDDEFLAAQQAYADTHPWFAAHRLEASSHFPCLEVPEQVAAAIEQFLAVRW